MARARTLLDWLILDPGAGQPLYRQIYEQIRNAVISGKVAAKPSVPASRGWPPASTCRASPCFKLTTS